MTEEFRREPTGVVGSEFSEELAFRSSELRLSEPSLKPLLMELLSSHLQLDRDRGRDQQTKKSWLGFNWQQIDPVNDGKVRTVVGPLAIFGIPILETSRGLTLLCKSSRGHNKCSQRIRHLHYMTRLRDSHAEHPAANEVACAADKMLKTECPSNSLARYMQHEWSHGNWGFMTLRWAEISLAVKGPCPAWVFSQWGVHVVWKTTIWLLLIRLAGFTHCPACE